MFAKRSALVVALFAALACAPSIGRAQEAPEVPNDQPKPSAVTKWKDAAKQWWQNGAQESSVDAFGNFGHSISIEVPAFREITPSLSLTYESSAANGWLGVGWSLQGVGRIERANPGRGAPAYNASDIYLLNGEELVACAAGSASPSCTTGGTHSTKTESYARIALTGTGAASRWTVTEKDGTRKVFAPVHAVGSGEVYRWGLNQVVDTKNNAVTYTWATNLFGCCWDYLDSITYNGTVIKFHYEARTDHVPCAAGGGALATVRGRLKTIDVTVGGGRLRTYKLGYVTSGATSRSLLASVQQFGKDATLDAAGTVTGGTSLPAIRVNYQTGGASFVEGAKDSGVANGASARYFAMDMNGDGKTDMVELYPNGLTLGRKAWLSTGTGFSLASNAPGGMAIGKDVRFLPLDVNGDGNDDLVELYPNGWTWGRRAWLSNGNGLELANTDNSAGNYSKDSHFFAVDINGDGKGDMLELYPSFGGYQRVAWLSTGDGFTKASDSAGVGSGASKKFVVADVNGDGKSDFLELSPGFFGAGTRKIWLSTGAGFAEGATDTIGWNTSAQFLPLDVNGDGKTDMVELLPLFGNYTRKTWLSTGYGFTLLSTDSMPGATDSTRHLTIDVNGDDREDLVQLAPLGFSYTRRVWLSTGTGFAAGANDTALGNASGSQLLPADVDGDGLTEMVHLTPSGFSMTRTVWRVGGAFPDLLASLTDGLGGTTTVAYAPSSKWVNTNNPPIVQTATAVTAIDGRGGSTSTRYEYAGGLQDRLEKRFLGFRRQKETLPCVEGESTCPYVETWFRQDYGSASKPERIDHKAGSGQLLRSEIYEYTTNGATVPWTSLLTGEWGYTYVGSGAACPGAECKRTYADRTYNAYGEIEVEVDYGDYDTDGDEKTLTAAFVPNTAAYIVELPAEAKTFEGVGTDGALLTHTRTYYDGATSWVQAPSAGLPTTTETWLSSPSSFVETHQEYDGWGNVTAEINAVGARTAFTFDSTYHLFTTSTTNPLGQTTTIMWDEVCGAPARITDLDGQSTTMAYDPLCRMTEKVAPGGRFERHSWVNLGDAGSQHELVETPAADGTARALWTRTYFDGFRRAWRAVAQGPDAATGDIYVDTAYNARGKTASVTAAYYWVSGQPRPATYATTSTYDALDRPTRVTHPDGAFASKTYGLWSVTDVDELGRAKTDHFDADGKRVAHDELVDGEIKTTTYAYDARGNLAKSTDPLGNVIAYETDSLGRNMRLDDPNWGTSTYEYDAAGRLTAQTDAKGQRTEFGYDALGRKTSKTSLAGTGSAATVSWAYDEVRGGYFNTGKLTTLTDGAGSETFNYDVAGNVVENVRTIHGTSYAFKHGFDRGNRKLWTIYPDGDTVGTPSAPLTYDSAGRLTSIPGYVNAAFYDADSRLTRLANANGTVTTRRHSPERGWLDGIATTSGTTTVQDLAYARNAKGMITQVTSPFANEGWVYEYDELDRLTTATNASSPEYNQTLTYDAIGNITWNSRFGEYAYGSSRPHAVTAAGSKTYAYDATGRMTSGAGRTLTWDGDNRLASVTHAPQDPDKHQGVVGPSEGGRGPGAWVWLLLVPYAWSQLRRRRLAGPRVAFRPAGVVSLAAILFAVACTGEPSGRRGEPLAADTGPNDEGYTTFTYDANGARIAQVEGAITRHHLGDGYEVEVGGSTVKYVSFAGAVVARKEGVTKTWVHTDHLGSIQAMTDASGVEVHRKTYRPYGEIQSTGGTLTSEPRGYTGQRHDASGLLYLHARYYDPALGRFISPDTIIDGTDTVGLNRYAYVGNDPVNHSDIDGLCKDRGCVGGVAGRVLRKVGGWIGKTIAAIAVTHLIGAAPLSATSIDPLRPPTVQTELSIGNAGTSLRAAPPVTGLTAKEIGRLIGDSAPFTGDTAESIMKMLEHKRIKIEPTISPRPVAGAAPPPPTSPPSGTSTVQTPRRFPWGTLGRVVGRPAAVAFAAWDFRNGYNGARQNGSSVLGATGAGIENTVVGFLGGREALEALGDAVVEQNWNPVNYGIPSPNFN